MKIALPASALLALALLALPRPVAAATPLATFAKMKKAVLGKAKRNDSLEVRIGRKGDGIGTWIVLNDKLIEIPENGTYQDGNVMIGTSTSEDLSSLPPEVQDRVRKAIQDLTASGDPVGGTQIQSVYEVNGKKVDEATAQRLLKDLGLDFKISVDLDEDHYRSIAFGADRNHLVLSPKGKNDRRYVVALDPKSSLPRSVLLERSVKGRWVGAKRSNVTLR